MTSLLHRTTKMTKRAAADAGKRAPDAAELRARAADLATTAATATRGAAKDASRRARSAAKDAPAPMEVYHDLRGSRTGEAVAAAVGAVLPVVTAAVADAARRKTVRRAVVIAPKAARLSPQVRTVGMVIGAASLLLAVKRRRDRKRAARALSTTANGLHATHRHDVARMDAEGPTPGSYDGSSAALRPVGTSSGSTGVVR